MKHYEHKCTHCNSPAVPPFTVSGMSDKCALHWAKTVLEDCERSIHIALKAIDVEVRRRKKEKDR